jgi:hypothetical protein
VFAEQKEGKTPETIILVLLILLLAKLITNESLIAKLITNN